MLRDLNTNMEKNGQIFLWLMPQVHVAKNWYVVFCFSIWLSFFNQSSKLAFKLLLSQPASTEHDIVSGRDGNKSLNHISRHQKVNVVSTSLNRSSSRHSHGNIAKILNSRYIMMKRKVCESLAVSNAVELLKLVFLNTSASPEAQSSLGVTLQRYTEHEIFAAFNFLKEKNFIVSIRSFPGIKLISNICLIYYMR